ncbi:MAG: tetratricopeptide repeat protein [Phycisphaeraceae bacterium]|nr:tetratricopeptide repeat protein [Phycisphaeraceae bacterium]
MRTRWGTKLLAVVAVSGAICGASAAPADEKAYRAGVGLANKGVNEGAIEELNKYLAGDPEGPNATSARYTLGVCLAKLEKYPDAMKALDLVVGVKDFAFVNDARLLRAQCAAGTGDYSGASAGLKKLMREAPQFEKADRAVLLYGESQYRLGRAQQARAALQDFSKKWPASGSLDRAELICALAEISLSDNQSASALLEGILKRSPDGACAGNAALALGQCRQSAGDSAGAREMYQRAAKAGGAIAFDANLEIARLARASGDTASAEAALRELDGMRSTPDQRALVDFERGRLLLQAGKADEAGAVFERIATSGPEAVRANAELWRAKCELQGGKSAEALARLSQLAKTAGENELPEVLFDRAVALAQTGDDAGAASAWEDWRGRFASHALAAQADSSLAACLYRLGKYERSAAVCAAILERGGNDARMSEIVLLLGEDQFLMESYADAERTFAMFSQRFPDDAAKVRAETRRGICLEKLGRSDDAERVLERAVAGSAPSADSKLRAGAFAALGDLSVRRQDWGGAEKWFARAIEASGVDAGADLNLRAGVAMARQGKNDAALTLLEKAWKSAAGTALENHAAYEYAGVLARLGRADEATARLTAIVESEKGTTELSAAALRQLAAIASNGGDAKTAAEALAKIGGSDRGALLEQAGAWLAASEYAKAEEASRLYLEQGVKGKGATLAHARHAIAMNRLGRHEEAVKEFGSIAAKAGSLDAETQSAFRYETALALRALGRDEEAASAYRALLDGQPTAMIEAYAALDLGQIALGAKKLDEAAALLERSRGAAEKLPPSEAARIGERETYLRALCAQESGKPADAVKALEDFEKKYPTSDVLSAALLTLGDVLGKCGRARDAAAVLSRVAEMPATGANRSFALLKLGEVSASASLWDESEKAYSRFLEGESASPLWFQARFGQGWARENLAKYDQACEAYRDVVEKHEGPTAARAQFQIGECLYAQKKLDEAVRELLKVDVLYGYPEWSAAALYEAGRCMRELGREKEASAQFEEVVKRFPETRWAALAKEIPAVSAAGSASKTESGVDR